MNIIVNPLLQSPLELVWKWLSQSGAISTMKSWLQFVSYPDYTLSDPFFVYLLWLSSRLYRCLLISTGNHILATFVAGNPTLATFVAGNPT